MKGAKKALSIGASAFISLCFLVGCAESVDFDAGDLMIDMDVQPLQTATYEEYSRQAIEDYYAVANNYLDEDGAVDVTNADVIGAATTAAAKLFAYACYNERRLDKYVFFANQDGYTDISSGSASATKQEYYLRINESDTTCGYRYHYTIKYVNSSEGTISMFKDAFESARTRITDKTDLLYRLEGSDIKVGARNEQLDYDILTCKWETGKDWGKHDIKMIKSDYIEPDKIEEDIVEHAGEDNITMRANINILAENIVNYAVILDDINDKEEQEGYIVIMGIDTNVANSDEASLKMLRKANGSDDCEWVNEDGETGLSIVFRLWKNGLFRMYTVSEKWKGKISGFSGTADSSTQYYYSYSDRDCDMSKYLEVLEAAKLSKGE